MSDNLSRLQKKKYSIGKIICVLHGWKSSDRISRHRNLIPNVVSRVSKGIFSVMLSIFTCVPHIFMYKQ